MVRPLTCICVLLASCSGAYLFHTKSEATVLDRHIEKRLKDTEALREQTRMLHAEWTLLNDPERLRLFADRYLALKPVSPQQFTSLNDLAVRLPAIETPEMAAAPAIDEHTGVTAQAAIPDIDAAPELVGEELPVPPLLAPPPLFVAAPPTLQFVSPQLAERKAPVHRPPLQLVEPPAAPRQAAQADPRPPAPRVVEPRVVEVRHAAIQPVPARSVVSAPSASVFAQPPPLQAQRAQMGGSQMGGSLLGGAQSSLPAPLPRPMPFNNVQYNIGN